MLDLRRMMLLRDLADLGSVAAVADRREISSSAVSQQLRVLEEETGAVLFRRDGRTLGLTRSGRVLVDHARRVLTAVDEAESAVAQTREPGTGRVALAAFNMAVPTLAAPMVRRLRTTEPGLHVEIQQETTIGALRLLRQGEVDIAVICRYDHAEQDVPADLAGETLLVEPLVVLAPIRSHRRILEDGPAALADEPWVTGPPDSGLEAALLRTAARAGFTPRIEHRLIGAQNICDLAATEVASALVPRLSVPGALASLIVAGIEVGTRTIDAVIRVGRQRDPAIAQVLRTLRAVATETSPAASPAASPAVSRKAFGVAS